MNGFIKITENLPLKGYDKIAILLREIGPEPSVQIYKSLNLSAKQYRKIQKHLKKLGKYNPNDYSQVRNEIAVLQETLNFGKSRGIFNPQKAYENSFFKKTESDIKQIAKEDPDTIANILKNWLQK